MAAGGSAAAASAAGLRTRARRVSILCIVTAFLGRAFREAVEDEGLAGGFPGDGVDAVGEALGLFGGDDFCDFRSEIAAEVPAEVFKEFDVADSPVTGYVLDSSGYGLAAFRVAGALGFRPASSSGTRASRAGQGARPTWAAAVVISCVEHIASFHQ